MFKRINISGTFLVGQPQAHSFNSKFKLKLSIVDCFKQLQLIFSICDLFTSVFPI